MAQLLLVLLVAACGLLQVGAWRDVPRLQTRWIAAAGAASLGLMGLPNPDLLLSPHQPLSVEAAHADSTGKMSTKLTARKRYLPRITEAVTEFNEMAKSPQAPSSSTFLAKESADGLGRAMNLYGASLRKGEVPDAISREAERLTAVFKASLETAAKSRAPADIERARADFDVYLKFAGLPTTQGK